MSVVAKLLALELTDPDEDIKIYLNTQGGNMHSIMAILDVMATVRAVALAARPGMPHRARVAWVPLSRGGPRFATPAGLLGRSPPLQRLTGCPHSSLAVYCDTAQAEHLDRRVWVLLEHARAGPRRGDKGQEIRNAQCAHHGPSGAWPASVPRSALRTFSRSSCRLSLPPDPPRPALPAVFCTALCAQNSRWGALGGQGPRSRSRRRRSIDLSR